MLFLGHSEVEKLDIDPNKMRFDSMDGEKWNALKDDYEEVQLAEHVIHSFFLDRIDERLLNGTLPKHCGQKMVDIVVRLRDEMELMVKQKSSGKQFLKLLNELDEMATQADIG